MPAQALALLEIESARDRALGEVRQLRQRLSSDAQARPANAAGCGTTGGCARPVAYRFPVRREIQACWISTPVNYIQIT